MNTNIILCPIAPGQIDTGTSNHVHVSSFATSMGHDHKAGPSGFTDYSIAVVAVIIVLYTFYLSLKYLFKPGEISSSHIKYQVLIDWYERKY